MEDLKKLFVYVVVGLLISMSLYTIYFIGSFDEGFKKSYQLKMLKSHIENNNLEILDKQNIIYSNEWESDKDLISWHNYIIENFQYDRELYNCKYWSLVWALYFEKNNVDYKFITTSNHIFVLAEYENRYCIADQENLDCTYIIG